MSVRKKGAVKARRFRCCESQSEDCRKLFRSGFLLFCAGVPLAGVHHRVMPAVPVQTLLPYCSGCLSGSSQWQRPHRPGQKQKLGKQCLVHIYLDRSAWRWKGAFPFTCFDSVRDWLSHNYSLLYSHLISCQCNYCWQKLTANKERRTAKKHVRECLVTYLSISVLSVHY